MRDFDVKIILWWREKGNNIKLTHHRPSTSVWHRFDRYNRTPVLYFAAYSCWLLVVLQLTNETMRSNLNGCWILTDTRCNMWPTLLVAFYQEWKSIRFGYEYELKCLPRAHRLQVKPVTPSLQVHWPDVLSHDLPVDPTAWQAQAKRTKDEKKNLLAHEKEQKSSMKSKNIPRIDSVQGETKVQRVSWMWIQLWLLAAPFWACKIPFPSNSFASIIKFNQDIFLREEKTFPGLDTHQHQTSISFHVMELFSIRSGPSNNKNFVCLSRGWYRGRGKICQKKIFIHF